MLVMNLSSSLLVLLLSVASSSTRNTVEAQQQSSCNLECPSNAPCVFGQARINMVELLEDSSPSPSEADNVDMHCDCPVGWTGLLCNVKFESCDTEARHECYHGGECVLGLKDEFGNEQLFCDCNNIADGQFVGKYCETPNKRVQPDNFDEEGNIVGQEMEGSTDPISCGDAEHPCLHGGICVETEVLDSDTGLPFLDFSCDCSLAYGDNYRFVGETCELKILRGDSDPMPCGDAEHTCLHGGSCVGTEVLDSDGTSDLDYSCDCSAAYGNKYRFVGETCEVKKLREDLYDPIPCGDAEHICLHGGRCIETEVPDFDDTFDYSCDCSMAYGDKYRFVGETCEIKTLRDDFNGVGDTNVDNECVQKCLNGGKCTKGERDVEFLRDIHLPTNTKKFMFEEFTSSDNWYLDANQKGHLAYCECDKGWIGNTCEYPADVCEDNNVCLHGSKCGVGNLVDGYSCDCEESDLNCYLKMNGLKLVSDGSDSASIGMIVGILFAVLVMIGIGIGIWKFNKNSITFPPCKNDGVMNHQDRDEEEDIAFEHVIIESDNTQIPSNKEFV